MSTISDKVLDKIKKDKLAPKPKWQFRLRDSGQWIVFALLFCLAIASAGLLLFFWADNPILDGGRMGAGMVFGRMPLIFLALVVVGIILALIDFKYTGRGYRYSFLKIGVVLTISLLIVGWLFNFLGFSQGLDRAISSAPFYQTQQEYMVSVWQSPQSGRLIGKILEMDSKNNFTLQDTTGKNWSVSSRDAIWRHNLAPSISLEIKMLGSQLGSNGFEATDIRPFMPGSGGCSAIESRGMCGMMR